MKIKISKLVALFLLSLGIMTLTPSYAEYYIVTARPYTDCPCYCESVIRVHHYYHPMHRHHHHIHKPAKRHKMHHRCRHIHDVYRVRYINRYVIEEKVDIDLDRRTADDVSSDLQIN